MRGAPPKLGASRRGCQAKLRERVPASVGLVGNPPDVQRDARLRSRRGKFDWMSEPSATSASTDPSLRPAHGFPVQLGPPRLDPVGLTTRSIAPFGMDRSFCRTPVPAKKPRPRASPFVIFLPRSGLAVPGQNQSFGRGKIAPVTAAARKFPNDLSAHFCRPWGTISSQIGGTPPKERPGSPGPVFRRPHHCDIAIRATLERIPAQ